MLRYAAAAVTSLMLLTGLAACGGDDSPPRAEPTRTATTPTPTPSPTPPTLPAAAKANTKAGAKAFVRHYVDLLNYAQRTGDTQPMKGVEGPHCSSCKGVERVMEKIYARGGRINGGSWRISFIGANPDQHKGWVVDAVAKFGKQTVIRDEGKVQHLKGGTLPLSFFLAPRRGSWQIAEWTRGR